MEPIAALRRVAFCEDIAQGRIIDRVRESARRQERTQWEKDHRNGVIHGEGAIAMLEKEQEMSLREEWRVEFEGRLIFWDVLASVDKETALYLVLRFCLGYSISEIECGLGVGYSRVKYMTGKAIRETQRRDSLRG